MQQVDGHDVGQSEGHEAGEQSEGDKPPRVLLHALHVHLQAGEEHDVVQSDASEEFERVVALQDVQSILADEHAGEHHADDVRNSQFAHDDRGKQDYQQYHEEYQRGVGDGEICYQMCHSECKGTNFLARIIRITRIFCNFAPRK